MVKKILTIESKTHLKEYDIEFFLESILSNIAEYDIILAPEYAFLATSILDKEQKQDLVKRISQASQRTNTLIFPGTFIWKDQDKLYNSCPVINNGKTVLEYFKETTDYFEDKLAMENGLTYTKGNIQGTISWKDLDIGLEICRDHGHARLKRYLQNFSQDIKKVDLHIVLSRGIGYIKKNDATKENGYFILCGSITDISPITSEVRKHSELLEIKKSVKIGSSYEIDK